MGRAGITSEALLDEAAQISRDLGQLGLAGLLEKESQRLNQPEFRLAMIGPTSSGKSSTLVSLLGELGKGDDCKSILPVAVEPTTAHVVEITAGNAVFGAVLWYDGEPSEAVDDKSALRELIAAPKANLRRVDIALPGSWGLPDGVVLIDTPGLGAVDGDYADRLLDEVLGTADVLLLHLRYGRGVGPALMLLRKIRDRYHFSGELERRLIPVVTDVRGTDRIAEIRSGLEEALGCSVSAPLLIPRVGEVSDLRARIHTWSEDPTIILSPEVRAAGAVSCLVLPALRGILAQARRARETTPELKGHLVEWIRYAEGTIATIRGDSRATRMAVRDDLRTCAERAAKEVVRDLLNLIEDMARTKLEAHRREVERAIDRALLEEFPRRAEKELHDALTSFASRCHDTVIAFEQGFDEIDLGGVGLSFESPDVIARLARNRGGQAFLAHVRRMGGRGGVHLGMINQARQLVAKGYRLFGRRAPADLIRSGIPKIIRPFARVLKQVEKRFVFFEIAFEVLRDVWGAVRAKAVLRKHVEALTDAWLEGRRSTVSERFIAWMRGRKLPAGILEEIDTTVEGAWAGGNTGDDGQPIPGIESQVESLCAHLDSMRTEKASELMLLEAEEETLSEHERRVRNLEDFVRSLQEGRDEQGQE